jgi:hypothetical protein
MDYVRWYIQNDIRHLGCDLGLLAEADRPTEMGMLKEMTATVKRILRGQLKYEDQCQYLNNNGFRDDTLNFKLLEECGGDMHVAHAWLLELGEDKKPRSTEVPLQILYDLGLTGEHIRTVVRDLVKALL